MFSLPLTQSREETHEELQQYDMFSREETHEELQQYEMFSREETHEAIQQYDMFSLVCFLSRKHIVLL
jgi:hypothetical protein